MAQLVDVLYPAPVTRRSPRALLRWWESRRGLYNAVVGGAGLVTMGVVSALAAATPGLGAPPLRWLLTMAAVYALAANVCYTLGWLTELLAWRVWRERAPYLGPLLFREGLIFSVGLTLLPILLFSFALVVRVASWLLP